MIRISILYPNSKDARFDLAYYTGHHMPLAIGLLGAHRGFRGVSVEEGLGGAMPGSEPAYVAVCHYLFTAVDEFLAAFLPHAELLRGDMANYTDVEPVIQFNQVLISG